jgi:hypothetical protein
MVSRKISNGQSANRIDDKFVDEMCSPRSKAFRYEAVRNYDVASSSAVIVD